MPSLQSALLWIGGLAIATFVVVVVARRLDPDAARPAALGTDGQSVPWRTERPTAVPRPQVLQAQSSGEEESRVSAVTSPFQQEGVTSPYQAQKVIPLADQKEPTLASAVPPLESAPHALPTSQDVELNQAPNEVEVPVSTAASVITETQRIVTTDADSFWSISERLYGSGVYYRALFRHNQSQVLRPDQLRAGMHIEVPPLATLRALYPNDCPAATGAESP